MPIITPAFPAMKSALTVHKNHKKRMSEEFKRAFDLMKKIDQNDAKEKIEQIY